MLDTGPDSGSRPATWRPIWVTYHRTPSRARSTSAQARGHRVEPGELHEDGAVDRGPQRGRGTGVEPRAVHERAQPVVGEAFRGQVHGSAQGLGPSGTGGKAQRHAPQSASSAG